MLKIATRSFSCLLLSFVRDVPVLLLDRSVRVLQEDFVGLLRVRLGLEKPPLMNRKRFEVRNAVCLRCPPLGSEKRQLSRYLKVTSRNDPKSRLASPNYRANLSGPVLGCIEPNFCRQSWISHLATTQQQQQQQQQHQRILIVDFPSAGGFFAPGLPAWAMDLFRNSIEHHKYI